MAVFNEPSQWNTSLVVNGDTNVIPQSTPAGSGALSFDDGFPQITQIPLGAGGIAPDRKDFNAVMKLLGDALFYMQNGGWWSYNSAFDYAIGRLVLYTDGNLYKCIQANTSADPKAPTNSAYWTKILTLTDFDEISFKTGDIKIHTTSTVPNGWLLCNGAGVSRTTFSNLFAKIGSTYGDGDGSTTFNIPDLRDRYIIGADTNALGTKIAEQLPNINGTVQRVSTIDNGVSRNGVFSGSVDAPPTTQNITNVQNQGSIFLDFSARNSNSIYTVNGKVYPASIALNFIIKT